MLAGLFSQVLLARLAGAEGYGVFSTMMGMVLLANGFSDFGVPLNGPKRLLAGDSDWVQNAQQLRRSLSVLSSIAYVVLSFLFYRPYASWLLLGLPLVAFQFMQIDWILRAMQRHEQAALRQMMQSLLTVIALALLVFLAASWQWALLSVAIAGPFTYLIFWQKGNSWRFAAAGWLLHKPLLKEQSQVFTGQLAHQATYALPTLMLLPVAGATANGLLASHYLLFTSLGGFSLITIDLFMARKKQDTSGYARWMWLASVPAFMGIALGGWYYNWLFAGRGLEWQPALLLPLLAVVAVHTMRLIQLNGFLLVGALKRYRNYGLLALFFHIVAWCVVLLFFKEQANAATALWLLVISEVLLLLRLNIGLAFKEPRNA